MTELNDQRTKVFLDRYALKNSNGDPVEGTVEEMWQRVAIGISDGSAQQQHDFYEILKDFRFVPGGRILSGAGTDTEVTYYNCYVIPIETKARRENAKPAIDLAYENPNERREFRIPPLAADPGSDSREAILDTISVMVDIMSRGGGVGINWSVLRPRGTHLRRVNGTTSGPVSWMDVASHAVQTVTQGGSRRGAAMFMLDDWHPDVMEFVNAKRDLTKITGANVSVAVSDAFMAAVEADGYWDFVFPDTAHPDYNSRWDGDLTAWREAGLPVFVHGSVLARSVWRAIADSAWNSGEPGIVFLDRYNQQSSGRGVERIICVNPCGEQGLGAYSVCNLGSMNLDAYIQTSTFELDRGKRVFDWTSFIKDTETAVEFLDNVIDKNFYFLPENKAQQMRLRRIGLGVMGLADAMLALGIRYGSPESVSFTERVFSTMKIAAIRRSADLAIQKGAAPAWDFKETYRAPYFQELIGTPAGGNIRRTGLRNMFLLTQAPTGSTSILAGVNSGIEPYFAFEYTRVDRTGTHKVLASAVEKYRTEGGIKAPWVTSQDVTVEEHVAVQAAVQKYVDSSVSKTVNGPNGDTVEDVEKLYTLAYNSGLKGLAYFRDGCGRDQVLYREEPKKNEADNTRGLPDAEDDEAVSVQLYELQAEVEYLHSELAAVIPYAVEYSRPAVLSGTTDKVATRAGSAYVTVNRDPAGRRPVEVFFNVGKAGSEVAAMAEAMGRLASLALRKGATLGGVANQLDGVGGSAQFNRSIPHAISLSLSAVSGDAKPSPEAGRDAPAPEQEVEDSPAGDSRGQQFDLCPECDNFSFVREEGCSKCGVCGFSAC